MELELKHIFPYLAYNPKAILSNEGKFNLDSEFPNEHQNKICTITSFGFSGKDIYGSMKVDGVNYSFDFESLSEISICLRPLSDLTKEIEVNGEKFVPLFKLFRLIHDYHIVDIPDLDISPENIKYQIDDDWNHCMTFVKEDVCLSYDKFEKRFNLMHEWETISFNYMEMHEKLLELHFDINLLIDANLAIDINTLNNQS